jgi:type II secretory ATPase GspE/PulE/Tfp pilus assembly ATPase PilB-like protein
MLIKSLDRLLQKAVNARASDLHFEPQLNGLRVRARVDGQLNLWSSVDAPQESAALISQLKIRANLDIAEKRLPQDGRLQFLVNKSAYSARLSSFPTLYGEKCVLRILAPQEQLPPLEELGLLAEQLDIFKQALQQNQGLILITGATGSGKSTSLYSALNYVNHQGYNICTLEDPIEMVLTGINQSTIHPQLNFDYANALRALLRQDPDIIMLGEIRDHASAAVVLQAAQTGHLVLSTLHSDNGIGALERLVSFGFSRATWLNALHVIISQRLLRRCCPQNPLQNHVGRIGIFEIVEIDHSGRTPKLRHPNINFSQAAHEHVQQGLSTYAEIQRELGARY